MTTLSVLEIKDEIADWLRANEIDPNVVPMDAVPTIADGRISCPVFLIRNGRKFATEDRTGAATSTVDVPLKVEPRSSNLRGWLAGEIGPDRDADEVLDRIAEHLRTDADVRSVDVFGDSDKSVCVVWGDATVWITAKSGR